MKVLSPDVNVDAFFRRLEEAKKSVLFLDYDGTLAPFKNDPAQAFPYEGVSDLVGALSLKSCVRLVIITGRSTDDIISLLGIKQLPEIWGSHGREHRYPGRPLRTIELTLEETRGLERARQWAAERGVEDWLEAKTGCLALHFRGKPAEKVKRIEEAAGVDWQALGAKSRLELHEFDGGLELRTIGRDKGFAVNTILEEVEEGVPAAYMGDDLTDEDAFKMMAGRGLSVLVRKQLRTTRADLWIEPPEELIEFLERWNRLACH